MRKISYFVILLMMVIGLFGFAHSTTVVTQQEIIEQFHQIQKDYFKYLDLRAPQDFLKTIPQFSAELYQLSNAQHVRLDAKPSLTKEEKEMAGLIFIYDAMLISNNNIGVIQGVFSLEDFTKIKKFSDSTDANQELLARQQYVLSQLEEAKKLRPDDRRIDGWIVGAKTGIELLETGKISKQSRSQILKMIPARPSFNLWTAILILHTQDASQLEGLQKAAQTFVDGVNKGNDPCKERPQDCLNGSKAPYNLQAAVIELGDVFLRRAEYFLIEDDIKNAMEMSEYAAGTYSVLDSAKNADATKQWPDFAAVALRKEYLKEIKDKKIPAEKLAKQEFYQRVYECSSCHGRVVKQKHHFFD